MYLYYLVVACPFELLSQSLYIWNHYGIVLVVVVSYIFVVVVVVSGELGSVLV